MIARINKNWGVNVKEIKDIGIKDDKITITWLDGSTNTYQADNETAAQLYFNRLMDMMEESIKRNGVK